MELFSIGSLAVSKCAECKRFTLHVADKENNAKCSFCDPVYKEIVTVEVGSREPE